VGEARRFSEDVAAEVAFYAEKEEEKAAKKRDREARRAKKEAKKKEKEERAARKEEKKNGVGPLTITVDSSSSEFEWSSIPVSSTTPNSSDFDWESD
jgi:hypothetical protein